MREVKFRAWDEKNKWMLSGDDDWIDFAGRYWTAPMNTFNTPHQEIVKAGGVILMQYTGLKDANDLEIYEGDIVALSYGRCAVEWNNDRCLMQFSDGSPINYEDTYGTWKVVIGNIYENPELLEEK